MQDLTGMPESVNLTPKSKAVSSAHVDSGDDQPELEFGDVMASLDLLEGDDYPEFVDSITVSVDGACIAAALKCRDTSVSRTVEAISGRYKKVAEFSGAPVFRQQSNIGCKWDAKLLLVYFDGTETTDKALRKTMRGWFWVWGSVHEFVESEMSKASKKAEKLEWGVAWGGFGTHIEGSNSANVDVALPEHVHIPMDSPKPFPGITIKRTTDYLMDKLFEAQSSAEEALDKLLNTPIAKSASSTPDDAATMPTIPTRGCKYEGKYADTNEG
jgi:hypothetical protein